MADSNSSARNSSTRRRFLQSSAAAGVTAIAASAVTHGATSGVHTGTDETIRVGLVGCGGRGTGAALNALQADANAKLVAVGDAFADRAKQCLSTLQGNEKFGSRVVVDEDHVFSDFDNYKKVIDACDVVILTTPPHFRPQHLQYAVEQGKHAFVEKPIATDAPGVRSVMESCRIAKEKNLTIVSGLCWRYAPAVRETMRKILEEKMIGDIIAIESSYNAGTLWHRGDESEWSRMEYQMRNWLYYTWLSGDHIMEQAIHSLDKTAWLLGDIQPTKAMAMGGRQQRVDPKYGHIYDHFTVFYEYPTGQNVYFTCRQQDGTSNKVDEKVLGTKGQAQVLANVITPNEGEKWRYRGKKPSMYVVEHEHMFKSIREGNALNNGDYMCNSTMLGLMGRMATYSGNTLTWDECLNSNEKLGPAEHTWSDVPEPPIAMPGKKKNA